MQARSQQFSRGGVRIAAHAREEDTGEAFYPPPASGCGERLELSRWGPVAIEAPAHFGFSMSLKVSSAICIEVNL
jgi:hypothetical protein